MGKKSWLSTVIRAFRSTSKESTGGGENGQENKENKREFRIWPFKKHNSRQFEVEKPEEVDPNSGATAETPEESPKIIRFRSSPCTSLKENWAAIMIQTTFCRYLARKAFCTLKGLVKFQALVRGHRVRKQAKLTLNRVLAVARIQDRVIEQRARFSVEGTRETETNYGFKFGSKYLPIWSLTRDDPLFFGKRTERAYPNEKIVRIQDEAFSKREEALAYASPNQTWRFKREPTGERLKLLDRWISDSSAANSPRLVTGDVATPGYMALTESVRARIGSQSSPRLGLSTPDSSKKRFAYPADRLRCPSFATLEDELMHFH